MTSHDQNSAGAKPPRNDVAQTAGLGRRRKWVAGAAGLAVLLAIAAGVFTLRAAQMETEAEQGGQLALAR